MQANWSIILNVVLLGGVMVAIFRVLRTRKKLARTETRAPSLGAEPVTAPPQMDDIIAVRKLNIATEDISPITEKRVITEQPQRERFTPAAAPITSASIAEVKTTSASTSTSMYQDDQVALGTNTPPLMMFLLAKSNRQLAGYELLQAVLAAGLRFGEGHLFHRHQFANGQGPILCSLAAATDEGTFDLQNIGAFTVRGLCLYMHPSGNPGIDAERFDIMLDTAKTLSEDLDAYLLDDRRKPLSDASIQRYHQRLNLIEEAVT